MILFDRKNGARIDPEAQAGGDDRGPVAHPQHFGDDGGPGQL